MCPNCIRGIDKETKGVCERCSGTGFVGASQTETFTAKVPEVEKDSTKPVKVEVKKRK